MSSGGVSHSNCCFSHDILINTCQQPILNTVLYLMDHYGSAIWYIPEENEDNLHMGHKGLKEMTIKKINLKNRSLGISCIHKKDFNFSRDLVSSSIKHTRVSPVFSIDAGSLCQTQPVYTASRQEQVRQTKLEPELKYLRWTGEDQGMLG